MRNLSIIAGAAALAVAAPAAAVNLITNPGFETGTFSGWTVTATQGTAIDSLTPFAGDFDARLRTTGGRTKTISQFVPTVLGKRYILTYYLKNTGAPSDTFAAIAGESVTLFPDREPFPYTLFTQEFFGDATQTLVLFAYRHVTPGSFQLDDVSVEAIPEPAVWGMMITGFAMVGAASRRRRGLRTLAA